MVVANAHLKFVSAIVRESECLCVCWGFSEFQCLILICTLLLLCLLSDLHISSVFVYILFVISSSLLKGYIFKGVMYAKKYEGQVIMIGTTHMKTRYR